MSLSRARRAALSAMTITAGALALTACGGDPEAGRAPTEAGAVSLLPPGERRLPSELGGETLDGKPLDVADLKGKVVVLNIWASWCAPCRAEAPHFARAAQEFKDQGVAFVGINTRDARRGQAVAFEKEFDVGYPSLYDPIGKLVLNGFPRGVLNPQAVPSTVVLDRDGRIAARALGELDGEGLRSAIRPLIAEK